MKKILKNYRAQLKLVKSYRKINKLTKPHILCSVPFWKIVTVVSCSWGVHRPRSPSLKLLHCGQVGMWITLWCPRRELVLRRDVVNEKLWPRRFEPDIDERRLAGPQQQQHKRYLEKIIYFTPIYLFIFFSYSNGLQEFSYFTYLLTQFIWLKGTRSAINLV